MEQRQSRLEVVRELPDEQPPAPDPLISVGATALMLGLKALSQRAITAVADLFMLLTVGSAWWLWASIPDPHPTQITALGIYAVFVLCANIIVRKLR